VPNMKWMFSENPTHPGCYYVKGRGKVAVLRKVASVIYVAWDRESYCKPLIGCHLPYSALVVTVPLMLSDS